MLKNVQYDTFSEYICHVDFQRIKMDEEITTKVPVSFKGTPKGVEAGGILEHGTEDIEIRCLPDNIVSNLEVSIADLEIGDTIYVKDLKVPEGVKIETEPTQVIVHILQPKAEEEAVAPGELEEMPKEPELVGKKKEEEQIQE